MEGWRNCHITAPVGAAALSCRRLYFPSVLYVGGRFKGCLACYYTLCCRTNVSHSGTVINPFGFAIKERIPLQNNFPHEFLRPMAQISAFTPCFFSLLSAHRHKRACAQPSSDRKAKLFRLKGGKSLTCSFINRQTWFKMVTGSF